MTRKTLLAVELQSAAMAAGNDDQLFEVGVFSFETEEMLIRTWDRSVLLKSVGWLQRQNSLDRNIYIRPNGEHGLSLVDDLTFETVKEMRRQDFIPAAIVQTSPHNYQVWLRHGRTLNKELSTAAAKELARRFGGDRGSADWRHFGRLAGFTNRKPKHRGDDGRFPFVRLIEANGRCFPASELFLRHVEDRLEEENRRKQELRAQFRYRQRNSYRTPRKDLRHFRQDPRYAGAYSRSDMAYAIYALDHGVDPTTIEDEILHAGIQWKGSVRRQRDYVARILRKAQKYLTETRRPYDLPPIFSPGTMRHSPG